MTDEQRAELLALAERVERLTGTGVNSIDVLCEIALFQSGDDRTSVCANNAGTKVIYSDRDGDESTCWSDDWTKADRRALTAAALRARAAS